jgi:hypothetical protein
MRNLFMQLVGPCLLRSVSCAMLLDLGSVGMAGMRLHNAHGVINSL